MSLLLAERNDKCTRLIASPILYVDLQYTQAQHIGGCALPLHFPLDLAIHCLPHLHNITPQFSRKKRWQPLMESDGLGYISTQEHVVPHIGATARFFGFNSTGDEEAFASRKLSSPEYKYVASPIDGDTFIATHGAQAHVFDHKIITSTKDDLRPRALYMMLQEK